MLTASQNERVVALQYYLERIAHNLVVTHYHGQDPADLLQVMNLYILERAEREPAFLDQDDGYITRSAAWAARDHCRPELHGPNHGIDRAAFSLDREHSDGQDPAETMATEAPDTDLAIAVRQALSELEGLTADIAGLMLAGVSGGDIAKELDISAQVLYYHRTKIRAALQAIHQPVRG